MSVSAPAPSSTRVYAIESRQRASPKIRRIPRRLPSPSSQTLATKRIGAEVRSCAACREPAIASRAVRPAPLSEIPGPSSRSPSNRSPTPKPTCRRSGRR
jgi:hypothetical protein